MITAQDFSLPPRGLPLRVLLSGMAVGVLLLLSQHRSWDELAGLLPSEPALWLRSGVSMIILIMALLFALSTGLAVGMLARRMGSPAVSFTAFLGRAVACCPVVALAWGFIGGWIGHLGWPVETLMPEHLAAAQDHWQATLGSALWGVLAPALVLAVPLCGEVVHAVASDARLTVDLEFSLRARGVPPGVRLYRHHLRQMLPLLRVRMQALCLVAPAYLMVVEDVFHVAGWGGSLAEAIRTGGVNAIAQGFATGGVMIALLCVGCQMLPGRLRRVNGVLPALAWHPWLLWTLGFLALPSADSFAALIVWVVVLIVGSSSWHRTWANLESQLPLDPSRALGASETTIWRTHVAVVQFRTLVAWLCAALAQTLLWMAVACALQPRLISELDPRLAGLFKPLSVQTTREAAQTLADPSALLQAGGIIALAALCLIQVSRIVQPRPR